MLLHDHEVVVSEGGGVLTVDVSVIITAYNRPDLLRESIGSVINQTVLPKEIVVVDDCSPKDLVGVLSEVNSEIPILYHRLNRNSGANYSRNKGVFLSSSEYVAFLDDDDIWLPCKLEKQLLEIQGGEACLSGYELLESGKKHIVDTKNILEQDLRQGNEYCGMSGLLCRREYLVEHPFDVDLPCGQDWDLYISLAKKGNIAYVNESCFRYRTASTDSITTKQKSISVEDIKHRLKVSDKHREWMGEDAYNARVAAAYLAYIRFKTKPFRFIKASFKHAGIKATILYVYRSLKRKVALSLIG